MTDLDQKYRCPVCRDTCLDTLRPNPKMGIILDHCPECGGLWLRASEARPRRCVPDRGPLG